MRRARLLLLVLALVAVTTIALTATNTVPGSRADSTNSNVDVNTVKPLECALLVLGGIYPGAGAFTAPNGTAWLVLGSAGDDTIRGGNLSDCIVGGAGNDSMNGRGGTNICVGGPGTGTFSNCTTSYQ